MIDLSVKLNRIKDPEDTGLVWQANVEAEGLRIQALGETPFQAAESGLFSAIRDCQRRGLLARGET